MEEETVDLRSSSVEAGSSYSRRHDQTSSGLCRQLMPGGDWRTGGREGGREISSSYKCRLTKSKILIEVISFSVGIYMK